MAHASHSEPPAGRLAADPELARAQVRAFLERELEAGSFEPHKCSWTTYDDGFSRRAGAAGLVGVALPEAYGGQGRSSLVRYVVTEEMLAAGAPCGAHWIADRQSGPQILRHGSEEARRSILPRICRGECFFAIGMSEPDSGSDLAAVRTRGDRREGGWVVNGSKIWTTNGHRAHYLLALVRTGPAGENRHAGLTQFIVDMAKPGVSVRPILDISGFHEFNEIFFEDYFVPDAMLIGSEGAGWQMVTEELAFERSGPDRFLSDFRLLVELVDAVGSSPDSRQATAIGRLAAHLATLREMSTNVARLLDAGRLPQTEAALVKLMGNDFERDVPEVARLLTRHEASPDSGGQRYPEALAEVLLHAPAFTLRGGTREILQGVIARGLGLR